MKIAVLDNIIDTEHIYQITSIELGNYSVSHFKDGLSKERIYCSYYFHIKFLSKETEGLYISNYFLVTEIDKYNLSEALLKIEEAKQKLETLRNVIIAYWSNNQSTIPKIEFT